MRQKWLCSMSLVCLLPLAVACGTEKAEVDSSKAPEATKTAEADKPARAASSEPAKGDVGQPCEQDADCKGGICLDLSLMDDGCKGKVCTRPCEESEECPAVAPEPDCDPIGEDERNVCLYGGWEEQYCQ